MSVLRIRRADESMAGEMADIQRQAMPGDNWQTATIAGQIARFGSVALAAFFGGQMAGFLLGQITADEMEIHAVAVRPEQRRAGAARELVRRAAQKAFAAKCTAVFLEVRQQNTGARAFYKAMGFREVGTRPRFYRDPPDDAVICRLDLPPKRDFN